MKNFDIFYDFLDDLKKSHNNVLLIEAIQKGYQVCFEAVNINKEYLIKLSGNPENLKNVKDKVNSMWTGIGMPSIIKSPDKILPLLYMFEIKKEGTVNNEVLNVIHDLAVARKLNVLDKLNSDTTAEQFNEFIKTARRVLNNLGDLDEEEEKTWLRVKVFHDFGDGYQWIVALDEEGNVSGYMPSCISFKMASHCGNDQEAREEGDQYFELRKDNKPYLTVILDANDEIAESKSYNNQKNVNTEKVLPYLKWLLSHEKVKGVGYRYDFGYSADMNMGLKDFFGNDDEFIEQMEKEKPKLIGKTEKIILEYKRKLKLGKSGEPGGITEQDVIERFLNSNINNINNKDNTDIYLWTLRGILGRIPFNENQLIELIKNRRLTAEEIANTSTKLLTDNIQKELLISSPGADQVLIKVYNQTEHNNINLGYIIEKDPRNIGSLPEDQRMDIFNKYPDPFGKLFETDPRAIGYFPEDQKMNILNKYPDLFEKGFAIDTSFIEYFPPEQRMNILKKYPDTFRKLFETAQRSIAYFPKDQRMNILKKYQDLFVEGFEKDPSAIQYFSADQQIAILNKYPDAFAKAFERYPIFIRYFPENQRLNILDKFSDAFAKAFERNPSFIDNFAKYFPEDQKMAILDKFPNAFAKGFEEHPFNIEYFSKDQLKYILNKYPDVFIPLLRKKQDAFRYFPSDQIKDILNKYPDILETSPRAIYYFPGDQRMAILDKFPDAFAKAFEKDPTFIVSFPLEQRMAILNKYSDSFAIGFGENPNAIEYFPEDQRMAILNKYSDSFAIGFGEHPRAIYYFPEDQKMAILDKFPDAFTKAFKNNPRVIKFFPPDEIMNILKDPKFYDLFAKRFEKNPRVIPYFPDDQMMAIRKMFPNAFN